MRRFIHFFLAVALYFAVLPWVALGLDRWFGFVWRLPFWIEPVAAIMLLAGAALAIWSSVARAVAGDSLGLWLCGAGLACLLRSPCLLVLAGAVAAAGTLCKGRAAEPGVLTRFRQYAGRTPRWLAVILAAAALLGGLPAVTRGVAPATVTEPAILVQIRCKPGTADLWRSDFEQHVRPAIEEVVARGDDFTGFQFLQPALPAQGFDFVLLYTGKTFAGLDRPRPFPQYVALFQREGSLRALAALKEMGAWEDHVSVTLVHLTKTRTR